MAVTPSKMVTDRQKSSLKLQATREQFSSVGDALASRFPLILGRTLVAAFTLLAGAFLDWLDRATTAMVTADLANATEKGDNRALLDARDQAAERVRHVVLDLRQVIETFFGAGALAPFGIVGRLSEDPVVLQRVGAAALAHLRVFEPPPARLKSMTFDNAEWIELLKRPVAELEKALVEVARDQRQDETAMTARNRAIAEYDLAFRATASLLVGLFIAAGREDLADRVRPSSRRPGQTAEEAPHADAAEPTVQAG